MVLGEEEHLRGDVKERLQRGFSVTLDLRAESGCAEQQIKGEVTFHTTQALMIL